MREKRLPCTAAFVVLLCCSLASAQKAPVPNASFEAGKSKPDGWSLEGGAGKWEEAGRTGKRCISVTGTGEDCSYWRCDTMPLEPNAVYRVRFFTKANAKNGCIITCSSFANRDFRAGEEWEEKTFIFKTPSTLDQGFLRFGQWHVNGTVCFDDIEFSKVAPIHLQRGGVTLGVGERIEGTTYKSGAQMSKESSNYSRCCVGHTSGFNSNRWTLGKDSEIVYRYELPGLAQRSGKVKFSIGYYGSGECIVEARRDGGQWREVARFGKQGGHEAALPAALFPAKAVEVRLRSTGSFQITACSYETELGETPPQFQGNTCFLETIRSSADVAVQVKSLGTLLPGDGNAIELSFARKQGEPRELDVQIGIKAEEGTETKLGGSILFVDRADMRMPYAIQSAGAHALTVSVLDRASRAVVFEARASFLVPPLYAADFGYALAGNDATDLWWCDSAHKVSRERPTPSEKRESIDVRAAKGEYEPVQLIVRPTRDLKDVKLRIGEFRNGKGEVMPPASIKADLVAYVSVKIPTDALGCVGDWPDPLPPCDKPFDVKAGTNQPIWITFHIPRDAAAGDYQGMVELVPGNAPPIAADVKLHVYDYELPKDMHLQVGMNMSKGPLKRYHNLETNEEVERVYHLYNKNMSEHRIANFGIMSGFRPEVSFEGANWQGGDKVATEKFAGKKSLLVVDDDPERSVTVSAIEFLPVTAADRYEFSWAAKTDAGHPYLVTINQHDADKRWISGNNIDLRAEGTGQWKREIHTIEGRINPKAKYLSISLRPALWSEKGEHKGKAWFDEIVFRKLPDGKNMVTDPGFEGGVDDLKMEIDFTRFDEGGKTYLDELGFSVFNMPLYGFGWGTFHEGRAGKILNYEQGSPEYMKLFSTYCKSLVDHMIEKGWYDKHCVYWFDEPEPEDYPFVIDGMKCLKQAEPRMKRMLTEQPEEELLGYVDVWLPVLSCYDREKAWARQAKGDTMWWYICCGPHTPYPNNFIDHPAIEPKIWFWMTWQNKVTGCHIWTVNYWNGPLVYPPPDLQNPWEDPMSYVCGYGHKVGFVGYWGNGDGRSIYPPNRDPKNDKTKYVCGPVNSIRWELLREGIEDYETFYLLNQKVAALGKSGKRTDLVKEAKALLDIPPDIIENLTHYTKDPRKLHAYRDKVSRMIEEMGKAR